MQEKDNICSLINYDCPNKSSDDAHCKIIDGHCCFILEKTETGKHWYVRKERWYEKYYK